MEIIDAELHVGLNNFMAGIFWNVIDKQTTNKNNESGDPKKNKKGVPC